MMEILDQTQLGKKCKYLINWNKVRPVLRLVLMAFMIAIMIVSDWVFSFIPFVQIITFLLTLYFFIYGYRVTLEILFVYVAVDCTVSGGLWPLFISIPMMFVAWVSLPSLLLLTHLIKGSFYKKLWLIAIICGLHGFLFGQTFAIGNTLVYYTGLSWSQMYMGWKLWVMADIPWEIAQCIVGIISSLILLPLTYKSISKFIIYFM